MTMPPLFRRFSGGGGDFLCRAGRISMVMSSGVVAGGAVTNPQVSAATRFKASFLVGEVQPQIADLISHDGVGLIDFAVKMISHTSRRR
jgi:hypothetical protein